MSIARYVTRLFKRDYTPAAHSPCCASVACDGCENGIPGYHPYTADEIRERIAALDNAPLDNLTDGITALCAPTVQYRRKGK